VNTWLGDFAYMPGASSSNPIVVMSCAPAPKKSETGTFVIVAAA
jgi:hypothetical protein